MICKHTVRRPAVRQAAISHCPSTHRQVAGRLLAALSVLSLAAFNQARAQMSFEDVSEEVGLTGYTESWGASFGDLNGDNWPDVFVQGHRDFPRVYRNTGEGAFQDVAYAMDPGNWIENPYDDKHGAAFADFDNDGDEDILLTVSVTGDAQLLVNQGNSGDFLELAQEAGLNRDFAARMPVWVDYNHDGLLDVVQFGLSFGTYIRHRDPNEELDFDSTSDSGFECNGYDNVYGQLLDANNDGSLDLLCMERGGFPLRLHDMSTMPFGNITYLMPNLNNVNETVIGDFNNDLLNDLVLIRGATRPPDSALVNPRRIEAWITRQAFSASRKGFAFNGSSAVTLTVWNRNTDAYSGPMVTNVPFGQMDCVGEGDYEVCAEYVAASSRWEVYFANDDDTAQAYIAIDSATPLSGLVNLGFDSRDMPLAPRLLQQNPAGGFDFNLDAGLNASMSCGGGATGDFDNDMDVDLYLVCRSGPKNLENRLYENLGDGTFRLVSNSGAEGPVGVGTIEYGVGENAIVGDYDADGFLDLFLLNGLLYYPIGDGGPDILLRNKGNANNWLELDLIGTTSNRDGVGAKVYVTAGGVTQLREQNGGYHRFAQDHQRLHFGLAGNTTADISVHWPSGQVDVYNDVDASQLYDVTEGGGIAPAVFGPPVYTTLDEGDECGEPAYNNNFGPALYLWRDCPSDTWRFRAHGGRSQQNLVTQGEIIADSAFSAVSRDSLNSSDTLNNVPASELRFQVGARFTSMRSFSFSTAGQGVSCFDLTASDIPHFFIGASGKHVAGAFDLVGLGACGIAPPVLPELTIADAIADEDSGTLTFTVSIDAAAAGDVTFTASTANGTATAGSDYTALAGVAGSIAEGATSTTVAVTLTADSTVEADETFMLTLANVSANVTAADVSATGTIRNDDAPPAPTPVLSIDSVAAAENSGTLLFTVSLANGTTAGDVLFTATTTDGSAVAGSDYTALAGVARSIPAGQVSTTISVAITPDSEEEADETFTLTLSGLSANVTAGTLAGTGTILNDDGTPGNTDDACGNPAYDRRVEPGLFAWRDCDYSGAGQRWLFRVSGGGIPWSQYAGTLTADTVLTHTPFSLEGQDAVDTAPGDEIIDFSAWVGGAGDDGFDVILPAGTTTACLETTQFPAGSGVFVGGSRVVMNNAFDLLTLGACGAPPPTEPAECGEPVYTVATDPGIYVWRDCDAGGPDQAWQVRVNAGGTGWFRYVGSAAANQPLAVTPVSVESNDTLDTVPGDNEVDFNLGVGGTGYDGFDLAVPQGSATCLSFDALPVGMQILLGGDKTPKGAALDLATLGTCN